MLDVSLKKRIRKATHFKSEINQFYRPLSKYPQESQNIVYSFDTLNSTKFVPILVKEWFYLVKKGGYLVIDYKPNEHCDFRGLEEYFWWLWKGGYNILFHGSISEKECVGLSEEKLSKYIRDLKGYYKKNLDLDTKLPQALSVSRTPGEGECLRFVCEKTKSLKIPGDSIDKWTFGIITGGKRKDWMEDIIASIRAQKIPNYEIIVCGSYYDRKESDFKYIPFNERDNLGWISKKKNQIVKNAKYENICMLHDRIILTKNWYAGIKKWGNCFEHMGCIQKASGQRAGDWVFIDNVKGDYYPRYTHRFNFVSMLDYKDYHDRAFIGGQLHILKKKFVQDVMWNETYLWANRQPEDVDLTFRLRDKGYLVRFNPYARAKTRGFRWGELPTRLFDDQKVGSYKNYFDIRLWGRYAVVLASLVNADRALIAFPPVRKALAKFFGLK